MNTDTLQMHTYYMQQQTFNKYQSHLDT